MGLSHEYLSILSILSFYLVVRSNWTSWSWSWPFSIKHNQTLDNFSPPWPKVAWAPRPSFEVDVFFQGLGQVYCIVKEKKYVPLFQEFHVHLHCLALLQSHTLLTGHTTHRESWRLAYCHCHCHFSDPKYGFVSPSFCATKAVALSAGKASSSSFRFSNAFAYAMTCVTTVHSPPAQDHHIQNHHESW